MKIQDNHVVGFHYTLKDKDGNVIDSSDGREPLEYLHGAGNIIPGLESELVGLAVGDKKSVVVAPELGYGVKRDDLVISVPRQNIEFEGDIVPGMRFHAQAADGNVHAFTVVESDAENVKMDGNHPLAGVTLFFDVEIASVREATKREIAEGHPHMPGCSCGCHGGDGEGECCGGDCGCDGDCGCGCGD